MYLVVIAWIYVVLMMAVAEATNTTGTVLGAIVTFFLYGVGPAGLLVYLMRAPARHKAAKKRRADEHAQYLASLPVTAADDVAPPPSSFPDAGRHAPSGAESVATVNGSVPPVRKEP